MVIAYSLRHLYLLFILKLYNDLICESLKSREQSKCEWNANDSMGTLPGKIAQPRCKKSNQAGNCFIFNLYNELLRFIIESQLI